MYKPPVELIITEIQTQIEEQREEKVYKAVAHFVPDIDKAELMRALAYDRAQYEKGYADGVAAREGAVKTVGDRFRAVTDEELVEFLFQAYRRTVDETKFSDLSMKWCDGKSGCVDERGEIECTEEMHRACILRWLKKEAEPNDQGILGFV